MRLSDLLTKAERSLMLVCVLLSLGNFAGALLIPMEGSEVSSKLAAHGTYAAGGFWMATFAGQVALGFQQQFSSRRINSRRLAILKGYFVVLLPTQLAFTLVWAIIISFIKHTEEQKYLALACLFDILLVGRFLLSLWTQPEPYDSVGIFKSDLSLPRKMQPGSQLLGRVSKSKAKSVVEARRRPYGPMLDDTTTEEEVIHPTENPTILYAEREPCELNDTHENLQVNDNSRNEYHDEESAPRTTLSEEGELEHFRCFLRYACRLDSSFTPMSRIRGENEPDLDPGRFFAGSEAQDIEIV